VFNCESVAFTYYAIMVDGCMVNINHKILSCAENFDRWQGMSAARAVERYCLKDEMLYMGRIYSIFRKYLPKYWDIGALFFDYNCYGRATERVEKRNADMANLNRRSAHRDASGARSWQ
jgi:hypothetical protein